MARNPLQQYVEAGTQFTEITRAHAERIVRELVKAGELGRRQAAEAVDDLVERSRANAAHLLQLIQTEVSNQLAVLETVTKDAVDRLEEQVEGLRRQVQELLPGGRSATGSRAAAPAPVATAAATAPAKRAPAKKKAATKKASAKRASTKKASTRSTARKAPAKWAPKKAAD
jgi:polyhydroxyalkanoate synthesis regulator phasin